MKLILSHRRMVSVFKIISSLGVISIIAILYIQFEPQKPTDTSISINSTPANLGISSKKNYEIILQSLIFEGVNKDFEPYKIMAYSAIKTSTNKYKLNQVNARYPIDNKNYLSIIAKYGTIWEDDQLIKLRDNVQLSYDGLLFNSDNIVINLLKKEVTSDVAMGLLYKNSKITADSFTSQDNNNIVVFKGNVMTKIHISDFKNDLLQ
jgi:lipopolysaccharide export system protein LptC